QEMIFLPFRQSKHNKVGGTGLGLAYSKGLVELHGGSICVRSVPVNNDSYETTFIVELPLQTVAKASHSIALSPLSDDEFSSKAFTADNETEDSLGMNPKKISIDGC